MIFMTSPLHSIFELPLLVGWQSNVLMIWEGNLKASFLLVQLLSGPVFGASFSYHFTPSSSLLPVDWESKKHLAKKKRASAEVERLAHAPIVSLFIFKFEIGEFFLLFFPIFLIIK